MTHPNRIKGNKFERRCVKELQGDGIGAERIPLSGSAGGSFTGDINVPVRGEDKRIECKTSKRGAGFKTLYGWLEGRYALMLTQPRSDILVVLRLSDFAKLASLPPASLTNALQPSRLPFRVLPEDEIARSLSNQEVGE
jgi:hypothetical protein